MTGLPARPDEQLLSNKTQVCFISCKNIKQRKNDWEKKKQTWKFWLVFGKNRGWMIVLLMIPLAISPFSQSEIKGNGYWIEKVK